MSTEASQIQKTLYSYAAILNFTPSPQGLRAKFGACSVQNAQLLCLTNIRFIGNLILSHCFSITGKYHVANVSFNDPKQISSSKAHPTRKRQHK